jgi:CspA family cold shock protein
MRGTVKYWNSDKGYGFIAREGGGPELFCHVSSLPEDLEGLAFGDRVEFDEAMSARNGKPEAKNVKVLVHG